MSRRQPINSPLVAAASFIHLLQKTSRQTLVQSLFLQNLSLFVQNPFKLFSNKLPKINQAENYFNNQLDSLNTKFSSPRMCLSHLAYVVYLCSNTYSRFTNLSFRHVQTFVHTELYYSCIFNLMHHQGLKEQSCQKLTPSHSAIMFYSDEISYTTYSR